MSTLDAHVWVCVCVCLCFHVSVKESPGGWQCGLKARFSYVCMCVCVIDTMVCSFRAFFSRTDWLDVWGRLACLSPCLPICLWARRGVGWRMGSQEDEQPLGGDMGLGTCGKEEPGITDRKHGGRRPHIFIYTTILYKMYIGSQNHIFTKWSWGRILFPNF